eukprot:m.376271 g.376271  ORF g.376271 m.376271 type:complete len:72 (+) comp20016_c3_seq10:183-398(+)
MTELWLGDNRLTSLPAGGDWQPHPADTAAPQPEPAHLAAFHKGNLTKLRVLYAEHNQLSSLPAHIGNNLTR